MGNCCGKKKEKQQIKGQKYKQQQIELNAIQMKKKTLMHLSIFLSYKIPYKQIQYANIKSLTHSAFIQIAKDIDRSYPNQPYFNKQQNKIRFQRLLRRVALYLPKLGYTQGINFVSGYLLLSGMNQNLAFQSIILFMLHPKFMYIGMYQDDFPLVQIYCGIFWKEFQRLMPQFSKKVKEINLPDEMWIFQWFICQFLYNFPLEYAQQFFNFILKQKQFACIRISIGIMKVLEQKFLNLEGQRFQQQFTECLSQIKDYSFASTNIPIKQILKESKTITLQSMRQSFDHLLMKNNWYYQYFQASQKERKEKHNDFVKNKEKQYQDFIKMIKSGTSLISFERLSHSVQIMDFIEQKIKNKVFASVACKGLQKSTKESDVPYKRFSLSYHNNANLVESIYNKP